MVEIIKSKKICGRDVDILVLDVLKNKKISDFAGKNSAHIIVPKYFSGKEAEVKVIGPRPFVCKNCVEVVEKESEFSPEEDVCIACYLEDKAIKENKCIRCGGPNPKKEFWGQCETCFHKPLTDSEIKRGILSSIDSEKYPFKYDDSSKKEGGSKDKKNK